MSDLDEGRDLHAAFGTLLADEPAAPWTVSDDVTRGRALQRRRRTRAGAGIGLAAAAVMVFGVFGPLRPQAAVVQPGGTPPTVPGVPQAWFENITPSLLDRITGVVDWEQSRVDGSAADGFLADLTLVPVSMTLNGSDRVVELVPGSKVTGRLTLQWIPGGSAPGPALVRCPKAACPEQGPTSIVGGPVDQGATAGSDAAFPEGTVILDRQYPQGLLEMVNYPVSPSIAKPDAGYRWLLMQGVIASEFLSALGNPLTGPPGPGPDASFVAAQRAIVEPFLTQLGYSVVDARLSGALVDDGRTRIEYTVSVPNNGVGSYTASVIVSTFPTPSGSAYPSGSYLEYCTGNACSPVQLRKLDCVEGASCPDQYWATANPKANPVLGAAAGMALVRWPSGTAVEVLVGVPECLFCEPMVTGDTPILTKDQGIALAAAIGEPAVYGGPSPSVTPTTPVADDAVTRTLEGYGMRVKSAVDNDRGGNTVRVYDVDVDLTADNPVSAQLTITRFAAADVSLGTERVAVDGSAMNSCTSTTCTPLTNVTFPCPTSSCFQDWWAVTTPAYTGYDQGTLIVFRADGTHAVEAVVGVKNCPTCGQLAGSGSAFLTLAQAEEVLSAVGLPNDRPAPSTSASSSSLLCTNDMVKIVPAADSTGGATGERSVALEIYARNPSVSCTVEGFPAATLLVGADPAPALTYSQGAYQQSAGGSPVAVTVDENHAVLFVVSKYRCDAGPVAQADHLLVRLPGSPTSTSVELPPGGGQLELCAAGDAGHDVWVSGFIPREGGVA